MILLINTFAITILLNFSQYFDEWMHLITTN
jgi:hypothetical protein